MFDASQIIAFSLLNFFFFLEALRSFLTVDPEISLIIHLYVGKSNPV